ncbi:MAG TPA: carboxypeptidase-like regulatory domain-containing protein [Candidatus Dormibacteraeota bacterium]|nr:carboxypeptidase-like regulatory domain-containing protein [Candidatus Dormibacteraeota bacterium]
MREISIWLVGRFAQVLLLVGVVAVFLALPIRAQVNADTSGIYGNVRDSSDAAVAGGQVEATNLQTGAIRRTVTTQSGDFAIEHLQTGQYVLTISMQGFKTFTREAIDLEVNQRLMVNAVLEIGTTSEQVVVRGEVSQLETSRQTLGTVLNQKQVSELPLLGRNILSLTLLAPGVQPTPGSFFNQVYTAPNQIFISASGSRGNMTVYNLDGVDNSDTYTNVANSYPNPDAVQALKIETNNYSAESGRRSGAVVDVITKSGSNEFHGSAFEFVRNYALNATNFFTPGKPDFLKRHQFGGSIGGPVRKDKTFFFFDFQRTTLRQLSGFSTVVVPTAAQKNGDFSNLRRADGTLIPVTNPSTGQPFPNNQIDPKLFDPIAMGVLKYIPTATNADGSLLIATPNSNNDNQFITRIDQKITNSNRLTGRMVVDRLNGGLLVDPTNILTASFKVNYHTYNISISDTETFTPRLLGVFSATLNRLWSSSGGNYPTTFKDLGANIVNLSPFKTMEVVVANYFSLPRLDPVILVRNNYQYQGAFIYMTGSHELKFGADVIRQQFNVPIAALVSNGLFIYSSASTGSNLTDFMLGKSNLYIQSTGWGEALRATQPGFYFQDNYKVRPHLTLNMGFRWEPYLPWVEVQADKTLKFLPGVQSTVAPGLPKGIVIAGEAGVPKGAQRVVKGKLAPRIGFAYVLPDEKTTVRGGYGVFFDYPNAVINNRFASNVPFTVRIDVVDPPNMTNPFTASQPNPFPAKIPTPTGFVFPRPVLGVTYADNFTNGYLQQWNLTLEHQLTNDWVARASYVGSKGTKLMALNELNPAVYIPGQSTLANVNARRPLAPDFSSVQSLNSDGNSSYNSLVLSLDKKYAHGYIINASYTFGKSTDYQSNIVSQGQNTYTNPNNYSYDHALSDFDHTHRLVGSVIYELPFFKKDANPVARYILGDWQANTIFTFQSGAPVTIFTGVNQALNGVGQDRPDIVGNPNLDTSRPKADKVQQYFNKSAFQKEALGTFGTAGRNILRGPGQANVDLSLFKNIPVKERYNLQIRAEAFNAFNRTNFFAPNTSLSSPLFGRITTADAARILQLALRVTF